MVERTLPRFVIPKELASGRTAYYWTLPKVYRDDGCTIHKENETALGTDYEAACGKDGAGGTAATLNGLFDEWDRQRKGLPLEERASPPGTIDWLFRTYKGSLAWKRRVSARSAPDYERTIRLVTEYITKKKRRLGSLPIASITPDAADKLYDRILAGISRRRPRQAEKMVVLCRRAWKVVHRLHPAYFNNPNPNPWTGIEMERRIKGVKPAATREQAYTFAWGAIEAGFAEVGAAAVICFEWLQRPENVLAGLIRWTDYRSPAKPTMIQIEHHKTGAMVWHPLEETQDGQRVLFYEEAEEVLAKVPRRGIPIVIRKYQNGTTAPWNNMRMNKVVRKLRAALGLPATFTLDACRHGGMTELEEAELTDGQGRALSAHRSRAYDRYAKRTEKRALAATRKRHAYKIAANDAGTGIQNGTLNPFRMDDDSDDAAIA